jgi:hypothetical protein
MMMRPQAHILTFCLWVALSQISFAEIRPSFHLPYSAWKATDVVITNRDWQVIEVWKGDLKPKASIPFVGIDLGVPLELSGVLSKKGSKDRIQRVSGNRLAIFLIRDANFDVADVRGWKAASIGNHLATSIVWLEKGDGFAIQQWINPGPSLMHPLETDEPSLRKEVIRLAKVQLGFRTETLEADPARRAKKIVPYLEEQNYLALDEILDSLRTCGMSAWSEILPILQDEKQLSLHDRLIFLAEKTAPAEIIPVIEAVVIKEMKYWKKINEMKTLGKPHDLPTSAHYNRLLACLSVLKRLHYQDKAGVVSRLRDNWEKLPDLAHLGAGPGERSPILRYADEILEFP